MTALFEKCEDLEGRSGSNLCNLRIIFLPEGIEGPRLTDLISDLLKDTLHLNERPLLDRAHRSLQPQPKPGGRPLPFIVRVHYFRAKEDIMQRARQAGPLLQHSQKFMPVLDYTTAVARKRAAFNEETGRLCSEMI